MWILPLRFENQRIGEHILGLHAGFRREDSLERFHAHRRVNDAFPPLPDEQQASSSSRVIDQEDEADVDEDPRWQAKRVPMIGKLLISLHHESE